MKTWICILICIAPLLPCSQVTSNLPVILISQPEGLNETDNRFLYKDSNGYIWISSIFGLYRYDGKDLKRYLPEEGDSTGLRGLIINGQFVEDQAHNIWFTTYDALNCYLRQSDTFQSFKRPDDQAPGYFLGGADSLGQLWMLHGNSLISFHPETRTFTAVDTVDFSATRLRIALDARGKIKSAFIYNSERNQPGFVNITFDNQKPVRTQSYYTQPDGYPFVVRNIYMENDSSLWIASHFGLIQINPQTGDTAMYSPTNASDTVYFNYVERLNDSLLLISSYGRGCFTFHLLKRNFVDHCILNYNELDITEPLQTVYRDHDGGIWISVSGRGVAYFHPENWKMRYYPHTVTTSLSTAGIHLNRLIELPDGHVWAGSNLHGGFLMNNAHQIERHFHKGNPPNWPANNTQDSYMDKQDRIWIITAEGLVVLLPDGKVCPVSRDQIKFISAITETQEKEIVVAPRGGGLAFCRELHKDSFRLERIASVPKTKSYTLLYTHTDGLVYGTADLTSLDIFDPRNGFSIKSSLPLLSYPYCLVPMHTDREIWIGTNKGIWILAPATQRIESPGWLDFLDQSIVYGIVPVDGGFCWVSTNQGLYQIDTDNRTFVKFLRAQGTGVSNFNGRSFLRRSNGEIWFGSLNGITVVPPDMEFRTSLKPQIHLTGILVNDLEPTALVCSTTGASNFDEIQNLIFPFSGNTLSFRFSAFDYSGPDETVYAYSMVGVDTIWVNAGNNGFARYANLPPGKYVFQMRASSGQTDLFSEVKSLSIVIVAPIYRRTWFVSLLVVALCSLLFWIYRFNEERKNRIKQLEFDKRLALEQERLRIANDMHDDLGSGISALNLRTKFLSEHVEGPQLRQQMQELVKQTGKISQQIRETIWTINSKNDTIDNLLTRLHQYALDFFEGSGIHCIVELMPEQNMTPISGAIRREMYLTFKEALHNVLKHARATEVRIQLYTDAAGKMVIDIRDNGQGFDPAKEHEGLGLSSMRKRIEQTGGNFELFSDQRGTRITILYG